MARKVLVVDDEKLIVKGIRFSLEQEGKLIVPMMVRKHLIWHHKTNMI